MRIGYAKLGRSMGLTPASWGPVGGDNEPVEVLRRLVDATAGWDRPPVFVLLGRNSGEAPGDLGSWAVGRVENPWERGGALAESRPWRFESRDPDPASLRRTADRLVEATRDVAETLDAYVLWLGQHGTSNYPIPEVPPAADFAAGGPREGRHKPASNEEMLARWSGEVTKPQQSFVAYCGWLLAHVNRLAARREDVDVAVWLIADPRNYLKARDLAYPPRQTLVGQYTWSREQRHERYLDLRDPWVGWEGRWDRGNWLVRQDYEYWGLEVGGIPEWAGLPGAGERGWADREYDFGMLVNEARGYVRENRRDIIRDWVVRGGVELEWLRGQWSEGSLKALRQAGLGRDVVEQVEPVEHAKIWDWLVATRVTFTTPTSGSGWATTKPWEGMLAGSVVLAHPRYDDQGWVIPTRAQLEAGVSASGRRLDAEEREWASWLRPANPGELAENVRKIAGDEALWFALASYGRDRARKMLAAQPAIAEVARRLEALR